MSLALYMDVHIPYAVTNGLRQAGISELCEAEEMANRVFYLPL